MRRLGCVVAAVAVPAGAPGAAAGGAAGGAPPADEPDVAVAVWSGDGHTASWHAGEAGFERLRSLLEPTYTGTERVPDARTPGRLDARTPGRLDAWTEDRRPPVRFTVR
ncbi:hypothetical protein [Streptomyces sp. NPDC058625]|uniref:hypothetical protein n=1 Tax=Streptomyces sp. NPDC058625 TaxID=3346564 RepID=UPI00365A4D3F